MKDLNQLSTDARTIATMSAKLCDDSTASNQPRLAKLALDVHIALRRYEHACEVAKNAAKK